MSQELNKKIKGNYPWIIILALAVIFAGFAWIIFPDEVRAPREVKNEPTKMIMIEDVEIAVEAADTSQKRYQGLSGRDNLRKGSGMLFVFDEPGQYLFTMRGMRFDLDFIFINKQRVVDVKSNISIGTSSIKGNQAYDKVLEVNVGFSQEKGIEVGDNVKFEF